MGTSRQTPEDKKDAIDLLATAQSLAKIVQRKFAELAETDACHAQIQTWSSLSDYFSLLTKSPVCQASRSRRWLRPELKPSYYRA